MIRNNVKQGRKSIIQQTPFFSFQLSKSTLYISWTILCYKQSSFLLNKGMHVSEYYMTRISEKGVYFAKSDIKWEEQMRIHVEFFKTQSTFLYISFKTYTFFHYRVTNTHRIVLRKFPNSLSNQSLCYEIIIFIVYHIPKLYINRVYNKPITMLTQQKYHTAYTSSRDLGVTWKPYIQVCNNANKSLINPL